ncbi:unnamed protein product [Nippostrongylus brasiliensis]|uniref:PDZ_6 domain-containing protein n=1 Tax=Nippostrongylus brasiliensis TaxID=27835 RepID=A0A0N4YGR0_NIPBR|nr:unnamed protein product [Nippostrongylus brasiliensis]
MGGRAARAGVKIGDVLHSVNEMPVFTCKQAHSLIQKAKGQMRLGIVSFPMANQQNNQPYSGIRSVRLDLEAANGTTKAKRRFFEEQIARNSVTDRLLARKIQLGMTHNGAPSESTAGYDSVEADFAGGAASNTTSSRTSPR